MKGKDDNTSHREVKASAVKPPFLTPEVAATLLHRALRLPEGKTAFPWQQRLLERFVRGDVSGALDIPTGLGKTSVMAIWLFARARGAPIPRRLVYVVDRRVVVDQATEEAQRLYSLVQDESPESEQLRAALGLVDETLCGHEPRDSDNPSQDEHLPLQRSGLPISTLRGQFVDNRLWMEDPTVPAIIVGTIDMVGSRLLFEGYGTSRKMRPFQAGLLGCDSLIVLDEAHLVPPFEKLMEQMSQESSDLRPRSAEDRALVPPLRLLSLSATGRDSAANSFGLNDCDLAHPIVKKRVEAVKALSIVDLPAGVELPHELSQQAWEVSGKGTDRVRCLIYSDSRDDAQKIYDELKKQLKSLEGRGETEPDAIELFVGGRRVFERSAAATRLEELGFLADRAGELPGPTFLIATSAAEVGVDLDADHMVCDLVSWERMVQRLGRVNRRGEKRSTITVVVDEDALAKKAKSHRFDPIASRKALESLPKMAGDRFDASPGALRALKARALEARALQTVIEASSTTPPLWPGLNRPLADAWSMTSLEEHTGRPEPAPWLRGWVAEEPQTTVVWRTHLPVSDRGSQEPSRTEALVDREIVGFFEAAPPHASEKLETSTFRVMVWLEARARVLLDRLDERAAKEKGEPVPDTLLRDDFVAFVLSSDGKLVRPPLRLDELDWRKQSLAGTKNRRDRLGRDIASATLVVDARLGGLSGGLLDDKESAIPLTIDAEGEHPWGAAAGSTGVPAAEVVGFRVRRAEGESPPKPETGGGSKQPWRSRFRLVVRQSEHETPTAWLLIEQWRHEGANEEDRSAGPPQLLSVHQAWAECRARSIGRRLGLPPEYQRMLSVAALVHDEGKRALRWQRAFHAPGGAAAEPYAKTAGPIDFSILDGYRHELGSLALAEGHPAINALAPDLRDLALHLIAAHHGFARPVVSVRSCDDGPPSVIEARAREVALRFIRLQRRWGPWGLAWWESLLRSTDQQASRLNDEKGAALAERTRRAS